jgi:hypothetical protein
MSELEDKPSSSHAQFHATEIYRTMPPARKWEEVKRLRETAWRLKRAGVKALHPQWTEAEIEKVVRGIFLYAVT